MKTALPELSLDIRRMLERPLRELHGFAHADGRAMTPREAQAALRGQLDNGRELLPVGQPHVFLTLPTT